MYCMISVLGFQMRFLRKISAVKNSFRGNETIPCIIFVYICSLKEQYFPIDKCFAPNSFRVILILSFLRAFTD